MKILLDTDITSYVFAHRDEHVRRRFLAFAVGDVGISAITAAELTFGSDAALRQQVLEGLMGEISQFEAEFANAPASDMRH